MREEIEDVILRMADIKTQLPYAKHKMRLRHELAALKRYLKELFRMDKRLKELALENPPSVEPRTLDPIQPVTQDKELLSE